jgi:hypothetical protein
MWLCGKPDRPACWLCPTASSASGQRPKIREISCFYDFGALLPRQQAGQTVGGSVNIWGIKMEYSRGQRISDAFFVLGSQYFAVARFSASTFLMPICGNLYHHAVEMLLKGYLANSISPGQLKSAFGHHLPKLWEEFKSIVDDPNLSSFDLAISRLNQFEDIRYPDSIVDNDMMVGISLGGIGPTLVDQFHDGRPTYKLNVEELDKLALAIFEKASIPPSAYFGGLDDELKRWIPRKFQAVQE